MGTGKIGDSYEWRLTVPNFAIYFRRARGITGAVALGGR